VEPSSERKFVSVDPSKCIGCSVCEYVCALEKEWSFNPLRSRIRVV
jgi:NAD-dependent dihydropyrimidine dehydrogenase PreA subunit